jgi:hypothetical protein
MALFPELEICTVEGRPIFEWDCSANEGKKWEDEKTEKMKR